MYAGVPIDVPSCVIDVPNSVRDADSAFAIPKSVTTAVPPESSTLSGLMSRWTMPRLCAYCSARAMSPKMRRISTVVSGVGSPSRTRSDSPSTYGIV